MNENTTYGIRVWTTDRPFNHEVTQLRYESDLRNVFAEYENYKRILNPNTTSIRIIRVKKRLEEISEDELKNLIGSN